MTTIEFDARAARSAAYGRVVRALRDDGPAKLLQAEQDLVREAADALLFAADPLDDPAACAAVRDLEALAGELVAAGRWTAERADGLVGDVVACGSVPELPEQPDRL